MMATSAPVSGAAQSTPKTWPANTPGIGEIRVGMGFPVRDAIFLAMFATFLISQPVIIVPRFILARTLHLLDSYAGLIVPSIFNAFGIFLLRQFCLGVPRELEEAALIDGASYFRIWRSIILPLSRPILSTLAILFSAIELDTGIDSSPILAPLRTFPAVLHLPGAARNESPTVVIRRFPRHRNASGGVFTQLAA